MIIQGEKVNLRPIAPADLERMVAWSQDPEVCQYLDGNYPQNLEDANGWLQKVLSDRHNKRWSLLTKSGRLIGDIELDHITWRSGEAELRVCIGEKSFWNQGYGTDAVSTVIAHAFDGMGLKRVYLRVFTENVRAIRCYTKSGFRKEGRLERLDTTGRPREILLMRILRSEYERSREQASPKSAHLSA